MAAVRCIKCGAESNENRIGVDIDTGDIHCESCEETFTAADVREQMARWGELLDWIEKFPKAVKS